MLIGLTGTAGSGKDTFADLLIEATGNKFHRYALASPIKKMIQAGFNLPAEVWDNRELKESPIPDLGVSPRYLAQTLGTEWGRTLIRDDLWLWLAGEQLKLHPHLIITDIRFDNEAQFIQDNNGILLEIRRSGAFSGPDNRSHASETGISAHYARTVVLNSGTIEQLRESVSKFLQIGSV